MSPMILFRKTVDIIIKLIIPFVILALMIGVARLVLDLGDVFASRSIDQAFDMIVTNTLSMFVVVELLKSLIGYFEIQRLRITFIIDAAIVFILREIMIGLYGHSLSALYVGSLSLLLLTMGALRTMAVMYSPDRLKEYSCDDKQNRAV